MGVNATTKKEEFTAAAGGYISFDLYFKSGNNNDLQVNFKQFNLAVANNTDYLSKSTLTTSGLNSSVGATYSANLLRALTMEMTEGKTKEAKSGKTPAAPATVVTTAYQFDGKASGDSLAEVSGYNAHTYYNAVLGTHITEAVDGSISYRTATTTDDSWTAGTDAREELYGTGKKVNASTGACTGWSFTNTTGSGTASTAGTDDTGISILKVHFEIYLDGWDKACFDAVQGQNIELSMVFDSPLTSTDTDTDTDGD